MSGRAGSAGFIGRSPELAGLEAGLDAASRGEAGLTLLQGDSGVGKTRLVAEIERIATERGFRVLEGECVDLGADQLPYAALAGALRPLVRAADPVLASLPSHTRSELAVIAPELGERRDTSGEDATAQLHLFEAVLALLARLGETEPVLLVLEDIHWADRSTRGFCTFLARAIRDERIHAVLSLRSDELNRRHPLRPALAQIERAPVARRIDLAPFDRDELRSQMLALGAAEPSAADLEALFARSEGNPLFAEELIAAGVEAGGPLPATLRDAFWLRLERIEPEARSAIESLAIAGSAEDDVLAEAAGLELEPLRRGLRAGLEANVLRLDDDGRIGFRHALLREAVLDELLPGERADAHLALARALEARGPGEVWRATAIAHHFHAAGAQSDALRTSLRAASLAEGVSAHGEAASLYERALSLWPRIDSPAELAGFDLAELELRAFKAHYLAGEDARALPLLEQAIGRLDAESEPMRLAAALGELAYGLWARGRAEESRATLSRALELAGPEPTAVRARLLSYRLRQHLLQGRFSAAIETAAEALEVAAAAGQESLRPFVLARLGSALYATGRTNEGERAYAEAIALSTAHPQLEGSGAAFANHADSLMFHGQTARAIEVIEEGDRVLARAGRGHRWIGIVRSELLFAAGRWDDAAEALPKNYGTDATAWLLRTAEQALGRGDEPRAAEALGEARERLRDALEPQYLAVLAILSVDLEAHRRDHDAARRVIEEGLDRIEFCSEDVARIGQVAAAGVSVEAGAARHARDLGDAEAERRARDGADRYMAKVEAATEEAVSPLERAVAAHARADHARAHARADEAELRRLAAARWRELERPWEEATASWKAAEAALDQGDREGAARDATRARELARRLGSVWLVDELEGLAARGRLRLDSEEDAPEPPAAERPYELTERELQVLGLLATGMTNREIGERLFMAEKTASVHVSRILAKLGVRSRTEAAALAHRQGLAGTRAEVG